MHEVQIPESAKSFDEILTALARAATLYYRSNFTPEEVAKLDHGRHYNVLIGVDDLKELAELLQLLLNNGWLRISWAWKRPAGSAEAQGAALARVAKQV